MKILFLLKSLNAPSSRIRATNFLPFLENAGFYPTMQAIPKGFLKRIMLFKSVKDYDVIILQKKLLTYWEFAVLRKNTKVLIYDFDDAVYCKDKACSLNPKDYKSRRREKRFARTVVNSDLIFAANNELANKAKKITINNKIIVLPSAVETTNIQPKTDHNLSSPPIIGWVGSKISLRYLEFILPALQQIQKQMEYKLVIIANSIPTLPEIKFEFIDWNPNNEYQEIKNFDIGIMPLSNDPFSRGKSAYKLLQYMAVGVPSVCSNVGMNAELSKDDRYCLGANSQEEFSEQVLRLLKDMELRKRLGTNGKTLVEETFCYNAVADKLIQTLKYFFNID